MEKARILYCIPNMAGGGAERQLVYLAGELVRRGWDVHVALLKEGPNFEGLRATHCTIHKMPARGNYDITILGHLIELIRNIQPRLVQTWLTQMDVFGGIASRLTGTPFLLSERSCSSQYPPSFKHALRVLAGRHAAAIVCNSCGGSEYWQRKTGNSISTHVVHNALPIADIEQVDPAVCGFNFPLQKKVVLFAGRFSREKNIVTIVSAFKMVLIELDAVLLLCGEGELQSQIENLIQKENLTGSVILLGYLQNLWELMKRADLLISMSNHEGCPNVVLEAMACECPLVISDIAAHRAFLDEEEAFFVDQGRVPDIARAILTCLEQPESTKQMTEKARATASSFSIESVTDQYEKIYNQILLKSNAGKH